MAITVHKLMIDNKLELEECLKEYISPSTLSYNVQKFSVQTNASYNAQIEKATSQTRNSRLDKLTNFIKDIINFIHDIFIFFIIKVRMINFIVVCRFR